MAYSTGSSTMPSSAFCMLFQVRKRITVFQLLHYHLLKDYCLLIELSVTAVNMQIHSYGWICFWTLFFSIDPYASGKPSCLL
jgi:hypothetical protein